MTPEVEILNPVAGGAALVARPEEAARGADLELVREAARGDMEAFERLYQLHHRRVYSLCLRMTQNVAEAEDLTQEVFVNLFRKLGSFRGDSAFTTWLHRLTVNQVLMHFRKRKSRKEETTEDGELPVQSVGPTDARGAVPTVERFALEAAVAQLPLGYRLAFILHDVEGYEHEEIARMLGCAVGTSKSQLHKARLKLRQLLVRQQQQQTPAAATQEA